MKKLQCVIISFTIIVSLFLCSCYRGQSAESRATTDPQHIIPTATTDDASFYNKVLNDYETIVLFRLSETFEDDWNNDSFPTISTDLTLAIQENPNAEWSNMMVDMTEGLDNPTISSFGYILRDINNDNFSELFWVREDYAIIAIFTNRNGQLVLLDAFWPKHECIITNADELYIRTSSGATYTDYTIQVLTSQGTLLKSKQFGFDGVSVEAEALYYEVTDNVKHTVSKDRFDELIRENPFEFCFDWLAQDQKLLGMT